MSQYHILYIIGFMGSGKTTAGKKLASLLGWSFIDLDNKIEEHAGIKIAEIFSKFGEEYFRELEAEILRSIKPDSNIVLATGGGAPCYNENMEFMLTTGLTIYLKMTPLQLASRLKASNDERPLIKNLEGKDLILFIEKKLSEREKWYEKSHLIHNGFDIDINDLHFLIRSYLGLQSF
jgi:shikimate kinase